MAFAAAILLEINRQVQGGFGNRELGHDWMLLDAAVVSRKQNSLISLSETGHVHLALCCTHRPLLSHRYTARPAYFMQADPLRLMSIST